MLREMRTTENCDSIAQISVKISSDFDTDGTGGLWIQIVTPGCQIQESQGLQLVLVQMIIRTQQSAIVNVQLFQTNLFQYKGGLCTSHATWYGSQI